jgi:peptidoglycan/xylan/chitin deacetylase (PgdA/CDA1 family)
VKAKLKNWVKQVFGRSGILRFASHFAPDGAAILMYHSVRDEPERYANSIGAGIIHATHVFERQMEIVSRRFNPVTVDDVRRFLEEGKALPRRAVAVTFDDGFADNSEIAAPILSRFGIPAAFYLTVGLIGTNDPPWYCRLRHAFATTEKNEWVFSVSEKPAHEMPRSLTTPQDRDAALLAAFDLCSSLAGADLEKAVQSIERGLDVAPLSDEHGFMMNWDRARALQRAGHIVGCHTLTHPNVAHVPQAVARKEVVESKGKLDEELGFPVLHFSYPHPGLNPNWNAGTVEMTREAGYQTAVTTTPGPVRTGDHPLSLTRIYTPRSEQEFVWSLERAFLRRRVRTAAPLIAR